MHSRHELVWLRPDGWAQARTELAPAFHAALARWQANDWPTVVRRSEATLNAAKVCLGIALPPDPHTGHKQRIALQVSADSVARTRPPLLLGEAIHAAPVMWRDKLQALEQASQAYPLRVYGSLALQALTGQPYLTARSDIDVLFAPSSIAAMRAGLSLLARHAKQLPLDGELVFPSGGAVAWKEWINAERDMARVLMKASTCVQLHSTAALLASLEA